MTGSHAGRVVLITGGAGGIGGALVEAYRHTGAVIVAADQNTAALAHLPGDIGRLPFDAADPASCTALINDVANRYGALDVLITAHGTIDEATVEHLADDRWNTMIAIGLTSAFTLSRAAIPHLRARGSGRIIFISSQVAYKGAAGIAHYAAAKAGLLGFMRSLAREVAADGILVNAVAPGPVETSMLASVAAGGAPDLSAVPLGRAGRPEEIAPTVLLLTSSPGGDLYVGQTLSPNGGDVMI